MACLNTLKCVHETSLISQEYVLNPQWIPETNGITKPYIHCLFLHIHICNGAKRIHWANKRLTTIHIMKWNTKDTNYMNTVSDYF